jgi:hypothetical protein
VIEGAGVANFPSVAGLDKLGGWSWIRFAVSVAVDWRFVPAVVFLVLVLMKWIECSATADAVERFPSSLRDSRPILGFPPRVETRG